MNLLKRIEFLGSTSKIYAPRINNFFDALEKYIKENSISEREQTNLEEMFFSPVVNIVDLAFEIIGYSGEYVDFVKRQIKKILHKHVHNKTISTIKNIFPSDLGLEFSNYCDTGFEVSFNIWILNPVLDFPYTLRYSIPKQKDYYLCLKKGEFEFVTFPLTQSDDFVLLKKNVEKLLEENIFDEITLHPSKVEEYIFLKSMIE